MRDEDALDESFNASRKAVRAMLDKALTELSGRPTAQEAWQSFIKPEDVVGIKTNLMMVPTQKAVISAIRRGVRKAGVPRDKTSEGDRRNTPASKGNARLSSMCPA